MNKIELLKNRTDKGFDNLYVRVNDGYPIQVKLSFWNAKVFRFLLANAQAFEFSPRAVKGGEATPRNDNFVGDFLRGKMGDSSSAIPSDFVDGKVIADENGVISDAERK